MATNDPLLASRGLTEAISVEIADLYGRFYGHGRIAFQVGAEDEFTAAIERLTGREVTAFLSADQTSPAVASELFLLDAPPGVAS